MQSLDICILNMYALLISFKHYELWTNLIDSVLKDCCLLLINNWNFVGIKSNNSTTICSLPPKWKKSLFESLKFVLQVASGVIDVQLKKIWKGSRRF